MVDLKEGRLSTCITAYDQLPLTVVHVRECMNSTRIPDEIIVVNDGGDPSLLEMLKVLPKKCPVIYARINQDIIWNQNGARNLALFLSRGDYIALEDNDHIPQPEFYAEALKLIHEGYNRVLVRKRIVVTKDDVLTKPVTEWVQQNTRGCARIISVNTRDLLTDIKGFDEQFCGRYGWDVQDYRFRSDAAGAKEIGVGAYWVVGDWLSNEKNRVFFGETNTTKMHPMNYHFMMGNRRKERTQSPIGMLNFQFEVTRL